MSRSNEKFLVVHGDVIVIHPGDVVMLSNTSAPVAARMQERLRDAGATGVFVVAVPDGATPSVLRVAKP